MSISLFPRNTRFQHVVIALLMSSLIAGQAPAAACVDFLNGTRESTHTRPIFAAQTLINRLAFSPHPGLNGTLSAARDREITGFRKGPVAKTFWLGMTLAVYSIFAQTPPRPQRLEESSDFINALKDPPPPVADPETARLIAQDISIRADLIIESRSSSLIPQTTGVNSWVRSHLQSLLRYLRYGRVASQQPEKTLVPRTDGLIPSAKEEANFLAVIPTLMRPESQAILRALSQDPSFADNKRLLLESWLQGIQTERNKVRAALEGLLSGGNDVRKHSVTALLSLWIPPDLRTRIASALIDMLRDASPEVRRSAAMELNNILEIPLQETDYLIADALLECYLRDSNSSVTTAAGRFMTYLPQRPTAPGAFEIKWPYPLSSYLSSLVPARLAQLRTLHDALVKATASGNVYSAYGLQQKEILLQWMVRWYLDETPDPKDRTLLYHTHPRITLPLPWYMRFHLIPLSLVTMGVLCIIFVIRQLLRLRNRSHHAVSQIPANSSTQPAFTKVALRRQV